MKHQRTNSTASTHPGGRFTEQWDIPLDENLLHRSLQVTPRTSIDITQVSCGPAVEDSPIRQLQALDLSAHFPVTPIVPAPSVQPASKESNPALTKAIEAALARESKPSELEEDKSIFDDTPLSATLRRLGAKRKTTLLGTSSSPDGHTREAGSDGSDSGWGWGDDSPVRGHEEVKSHFAQQQDDAIRQGRLALGTGVNTGIDFRNGRVASTHETSSAAAFPEPVVGSSSTPPLPVSSSMTNAARQQQLEPQKGRVPNSHSQLKLADGWGGHLQHPSWFPQQLVGPLATANHPAGYSDSSQTAKSQCDLEKQPFSPTPSSASAHLRSGLSALFHQPLAASGTQRVRFASFLPTLKQPFSPSARAEGEVIQVEKQHGSQRSLKRAKELSHDDDGDEHDDDRNDHKECALDIARARGEQRRLLLLSLLLLLALVFTVIGLAVRLRSAEGEVQRLLRTNGSNVVSSSVSTPVGSATGSGANLTPMVSSSPVGAATITAVPPSNGSNASHGPDQDPQAATTDSSTTEHLGTSVTSAPETTASNSSSSSSTRIEPGTITFSGDSSPMTTPSSPSSTDVSVGTEEPATAAPTPAPAVAGDSKHGDLLSQAVAQAWVRPRERKKER
ncbi:unnamed protein product [Jaminaea pallidilutea]